MKEAPENERRVSVERRRGRGRGKEGRESSLTGWAV